MTVQEQAVRYGAKYMDTKTLLGFCLGPDNVDAFLSVTDNMKKLDESISAFHDKMSAAKAYRAFALMELIRRGSREVDKSKEKVTSSLDAYEMLCPLLENLEEEHFYVTMLNRANKVISHKLISSGDMVGTVVSVKIVIRKALESRASSIILSHNHPSGQLHPSQADIDLTNKIKEACSFMEIKLLDHVIIGDKGYYSFADEGIL